MADSLIIQKFGGTSVASTLQRRKVAECILRSVKAGHMPVVVVSAPGRIGEPYATDTLLSLADEEAVELALRDKDLLISCGEVISAVLVAHELRILGYNAKALTGAQAGIVTDDNHGNGIVQRVHVEPISTLLQYNIIPVVAGFQGVSENGEITTFSRGGSDTTAAVLGVTLGAEWVEIYTDVDGVFSADPRIVSSAQLVRLVDFTEAAELAAEGARVVHPHAVEIAQCKNIPLHVGSVDADSMGTTIRQVTHNRPITGITSRNDIAAVSTCDASRFTAIFAALAGAQISADFITITARDITLVVAAAFASDAAEVLRRAGVEASCREKVAKVTIVGTGMTGIPGVMACALQALENADILPLLATDSHTTISFLVDQQDEAKAIQALHRSFME
jgi:aspartate kinase